MKIFFIILTTVLCFTAHLAADDPYVVKVVVQGPAAPLYSTFGHVGIIVEGEEEAMLNIIESHGLRWETDSLFFDYGRFSFNKEDFYKDFAQGRLLFAKDIFPAAYFWEYTLKNEERAIAVATLNLTPPEKETLIALLITEAQSDNGLYLYHHYRDNCSTRIRDVIDKSVGGIFFKEFDKPSAHTYRTLMRTHTSRIFWKDWLLNYLQGSPIDKPVSVWDEMFLPARLMAGLRKTTLRSGEPLVSEYESIRGELTVRRARPVIFNALKAMAIGAAAAALLFIIGQKGMRRTFGAVNALIGLVFGCAGVFFLFLQLYSDHDVARWNLNILLTTPMAVIAFPLGILTARGVKRAERYLRRIWLFHLGLLPVAVIFWLIPAFGQKNIITFAALLPVFIVLSRNGKKNTAPIV